MHSRGRVAVFAFLLTFAASAIAQDAKGVAGEHRTAKSQTSNSPFSCVRASLRWVRTELAKM
jgi:hypothetical protein